MTAASRRGWRRSDQSTATLAGLTNTTTRSAYHSTVRTSHRAPHLAAALAVAFRSDSPAAERMHDDLVRRYSEPHRRYHDTRHLEQTVRLASEYATEHGVTDDELRALLLAAAWHDAVYDTTAAAERNERASANAAARALWTADYGGLFPEPLRSRMHDLVMTTVDHAADDGDLTAMILCDADLYRFAVPWDEFDRHSSDLRAEQRHVPDDEWPDRNAAILRHFSERRPFFYLTVELNAAAHANIDRALGAAAAARAANG